MVMKLIKIGLIFGTYFLSVSAAFTTLPQKQYMRKGSSISKVSMRAFHSPQPLLPLSTPTTFNARGASNDEQKQSGIWGEYMYQLENRPILTKSCTCCVIATIGDMISQRINDKFNGSFDFMKLTTFSIAQFLYFGPIMHFWFMFLDKFISTYKTNDFDSNKQCNNIHENMSNDNNIRHRSSSERSIFQLKSHFLVVMIQMIIDQTLGSFIIIGGFFYFYPFLNSIFKGNIRMDDFSQVIEIGSENVQNNLWPTLKANWKLWPLANTINFAVIPLQHRVLFSSFVAVFWNIYLAGVV